MGNELDFFLGFTREPVEEQHLKQIPLDQIIPNDKNFYSLDTTGLKESIALLGLQHNLVVRQVEEGKYELISGHRRLKALQELYGEGGSVFSTANCLVLDETDEALLDLHLIHANSTQRTFSDYEIMEQSVRVRENLEKVQEQVSGRKRDVVAKLLDISSSKLAKLEAIRSNLTPLLMEEFKEGTINMSVAFKLSGLSSTKQMDYYGLLEEKGELGLKDIEQEDGSKANKETIPKSVKEELSLVLELLQREEDKEWFFGIGSIESADWLKGAPEERLYLALQFLTKESKPKKVKNKEKGDE